MVALNMHVEQGTPITHPVHARIGIAALQPFVIVVLTQPIHKDGYSRVHLPYGCSSLAKALQYGCTRY